MSHAGLAIALIAVGVVIGLTRARRRNTLALGIALASSALLFHVVELLTS
jgi:Zn-dependent membrane protease YugP